MGAPDCTRRGVCTLIVGSSQRNVTFLMQDKFTLAERERKEAAAAKSAEKVVHFVIQADTQGGVDAVQNIINRIPSDVRL